jgi:hypothetical protein
MPLTRGLLCARAIRAEAVLETPVRSTVLVRGNSSAGTEAEFLHGWVRFYGLYFNEVGTYTLRIVFDGVTEVCDSVCRAVSVCVSVCDESLCVRVSLCMCF